MNNIPTISIITVVYNYPELLELTIKSVKNQSYKNIEYIIIDGGSNDLRTLEIIKKYEKYINFWISEKDENIYDAMNKGIIHASDGSYLNFLNSGDAYDNNKVLEDIFSNKNNLEYDLIFGNINLFNVNSGISTPVLFHNDFTIENLLKEGTGVLCHQAMFIKKEFSPLYNIKYKYKAELNWYFDIVENHKKIKCKKIDQTIVTYRTGGFGYQHFFKNRLEWFKVLKNRYGIKTIIEFETIRILLYSLSYKYTWLRKYDFIFIPIVKINNVIKKILIRKTSLRKNE